VAVNDEMAPEDDYGMDRAQCEAIVGRYDATLTELTKKRRDFRPSESPGVYFLFRGQELIFIGHARDVFVRVHQQWESRAIAFDGVHIIECPLET